MSGIKINVQDKVTNTLPLKPIFKNDEPLFNGFTPGVLKEVNVTDEEHEKGEYEGLKVPVLKFVFEDYKLTTADPDRIFIVSIKPPFTKKKQGEDMVVRDEKLIADGVIENWKKCKHIMDNLKDSPNFRSIETITPKQQEDLFNLPGAEASEKERSEAYRKHYQFIADFINGKGSQKSMLEHKTYKDGYPMFIKLVASTRTNTNGSKYQVYDIPGYVGNGFVSSMKFDAKGKPVAPKDLEFKPSESIVLSTSLQASYPSVDHSVPNVNKTAESIVDGMLD